MELRSAARQARCYFDQGMIGTTLIAFAGEPLMIFELTAR
jgi:hypothetical protein